MALALANCPWCSQPVLRREALIAGEWAHPECVHEFCASQDIKLVGMTVKKAEEL